MKLPILTFAALLAGCATHSVPPVPHALPACADGGVARVAVTLPREQTREALVQSLQESRAFPEGTQIKILDDGERPAMLNTRQFHERMLMHLNRFLNAGLQVDGSAQALLEVNADGEVTAVHPGSGNRDVDRGLRNLWRTARYTPVVVGECRVPAWLHVDVSFESEYNIWMRSQGTTVRS